MTDLLWCTSEGELATGSIALLPSTMSGDLVELEEARFDVTATGAEDAFWSPAVDQIRLFEISSIVLRWQVGLEPLADDADDDVDDDLQVDADCGEGDSMPELLAVAAAAMTLPTAAPKPGWKMCWLLRPTPQSYIGESLSPGL
jgi:hypothetical protein